MFLGSAAIGAAGIIGRPRSMLSGEEGLEASLEEGFRPNIVRGIHRCFRFAGEIDRAEFDRVEGKDRSEPEEDLGFVVSRSEGDVITLVGTSGLAGGGRGVKNLSSGFMVFTSPFTELVDALRVRIGLTSTGTWSRFTGWPGRRGQVVVDGTEESCISVPSSDSY